MQLCHVNVWPGARLGSVLELPDCTRSSLFCSLVKFVEFVTTVDMIDLCPWGLL